MLGKMDSMHGQLSNTRDYQNFVMGVEEYATLKKYNGEVIRAKEDPRESMYGPWIQAEISRKRKLGCRFADKGKKEIEELKTQRWGELMERKAKKGGSNITNMENPNREFGWRRPHEFIQTHKDRTSAKRGRCRKLKGHHSQGDQQLFGASTKKETQHGDNA